MIGELLGIALTGVIEFVIDHKWFVLTLAVIATAIVLFLVLG